jgi:hypothetical protein
MIGGLLLFRSSKARAAQITGQNKRRNRLAYSIRRRQLLHFGSTLGATATTSTPATGTAGTTGRETKLGLVNAVNSVSQAVPVTGYDVMTIGASFGGSDPAVNVAPAQVEQFDSTAINPVNRYPVGFNPDTMKLARLR